MRETYEMHRLDEDRPHVLSEDCWCGPHVLAYGETPVYDEQGTIVGYVQPFEAEDED